MHGLRPTTLLSSPPHAMHSLSASITRILTTALVLFAISRKPNTKAAKKGNETDRLSFSTAIHSCNTHVIFHLFSVVCLLSKSVFRSVKSQCNHLSRATRYKMRKRCHFHASRLYLARNILSTHRSFISDNKISQSSMESFTNSTRVLAQRLSLGILTRSPSRILSSRLTMCTASMWRLLHQRQRWKLHVKRANPEKAGRQRKIGRQVELEKPI